MTTAFPTLETPRLLLREIGPDDAPALLAIHGDAEHMKWFGTDPISTLAQARALVETFAGWRRQPNPGTRWGLVRRDAPEAGLIGSCGLFAWNRGWRKCTLGYELARAACGQGLMHEALQAVLAWGHETMQLHRLEAQVHERNRASLALLQRLGFEHEGRLREVAWWGGQPHDLLMLARLAGSRLAGPPPAA
ncbi:GNAT family N-acetyltransferase [Rubrivivax gelatinosus]|uniref:Putative N-acetyltransferase n=1 Tax=Rubrivivax gelatinosus (strain NBRC 100245 / IL144) TaxID=983917 RepID=I0HNQ9_RUBGI|nr:GNAT family protein [Rubrivivax gelatinosus]BAL94646.1 putative N-acetyltransferase [Rubrivivax gelatinosus IL144]